MQQKFFYIPFIFFLLVARISAQQIQTLVSAANKTSLRGLSVVSNKIIWVSGSKGTVGRSTDAGKTWQWMTVKNFETKDFRDIEAFDKNTAVIMAIAEPAVILKTTDGGKNWKTVFTDSTKGIFLDAMEFWNDVSGIAVGDPI
ncbi:MAG: oxidoreductase, partial [Bacteroidetes bacterium]|nr:oxidoreductase [Bacteroidota bacterium]